MPSQIASTIQGYRRSLDSSEARYRKLYSDRADSTRVFYDMFLNRLIRGYQPVLRDRSSRELLKDRINQFFGSDQIRFAAVDGTCVRDTFGDYMVFFGAAYAVRGTLSVRVDPPSTKYERWSQEQDVSMVSYIPIPFAELGDVAEEQFTASSDASRVNLTSIHTQLMLLAEIYLAYDLVCASSLRPRVLLWDQSMSGVLASTAVAADKLGLVGSEYLGRELTAQDVVVAYSHPYNSSLDLPSTKSYRQYNRVLMEAFTHPTKPQSSVARELGLTNPDVTPVLSRARSKDILLRSTTNPDGLVEVDTRGDRLVINSKFKDSWAYSVALFESVCKRLFKEKDQDALVYRRRAGSTERERWASPNDLRFLAAVGLRALVELCWKHNVLLVGIAKDSSSRYFSQNYLGCLRDCATYDFGDTLLPWTDRTLLELLPLLDESLEAPWSTVEFDSVFMTLAIRDLGDGKPPRAAGVQGDIVGDERLFARSLAQFFISRKKKTPLTGHAIFVDRLLHPTLDRGSWGPVEVKGAEIGTVSPTVHPWAGTPNTGQDITMYFLDTLTKNLYPDVIGYPDPLHKADWGAKSIRKKVVEMIESSGTGLRLRPLNRTFRQIRQSVKRT